MLSSVTLTDDYMFEILNRGKMREFMAEQLKGNKIPMGSHYLSLELEDDDNMEFFLQKAKEDLRETPEIVAESMKELKELIAGVPDLRIVHTDEFYRMFLRPCKWYSQSAFSLIKRYYRFIQNYPNIYDGLLPSKEKAVFCASLIYPLPLRDKDGCRIFIVELGKRWKPKEISLNQIFKGLMICVQAAIFEPKTQISGGRVIIDFDGLSLSQVTYFTPSFAKMVVDYIQKILPARLKSIHIVNQPFLFNMVYALFKPLIEEKFRKRLHFHGRDRESLMAFINKSVLLTRHGGELDITDTSFGVQIWQLLSTYDVIFSVSSKLGYTNEK